VLDAGDWSARVKVARRVLAQAWLPAPTGWLAFRTPALPPLRLPELHWPSSRIPVPRLRRPFPGKPAFRRPRPRPETAAGAAAWLIAGIALFTVYLHMSRTAPANSDGASNALQAWAMLHGNPLLRGWQLSDVSFYTTELPQYALLELVRGLRPDVVHVAAAMTYTLVVLLAARLARGRADGGAGFLRAALAAGIMLAPQQSGGVYVLMLSPDHTGSVVPVLVTFILLDRAPRRWWVPAAAALLLTWGLVADSVVLITGVAPLAAVGAGRAYTAAARRGAGWRGAVPGLSLAAAAAAAVGAAQLAGHLLAGAGGFFVWPVGNQLAAAGELGGNLALTARGVLLLFGANFLGGTVSYAAALALLHLAGIGLVAWALASVLRRLPGAGLAEQLLAAAVVASLAAYLLGTSALDLHSSREFVAVLPLGAALAGRVLAGRLRAAGLVPALALAATGYLLSLGAVVTRPAVPAQASQLATWLSAQHLTYGLSGYWQANAVTLETGGRVSVRPVVAAGTGLARDDWEVRPAWYDPARHQATFMVLSTAWPGKTSPGWMGNVRAAFGQPARIYYVGTYTVLVWNKNLLADLRPSG
jgi:hypothetical protein